MRAEQTGSSLSNVSPHIRAHVCVEASDKKKKLNACVAWKEKQRQLSVARASDISPSVSRAPPRNQMFFGGLIWRVRDATNASTHDACDKLMHFATVAWLP
jgi:hypothetical protein